MEGRLALLAHRVEALERHFREVQAAEAGRAEAVRTALDLGFPETVLKDIFSVEERRKVAAKLAERGWSADRIARVMNCTVRTADRYLASRKAEG